MKNKWRCLLFSHTAKTVGYTPAGYPIRICGHCGKRENTMTGKYEWMRLEDLHLPSETVEIDDDGKCLCHKVRVV